MEEMRIKCPSCGIVLDVRNSKGEAVKRITCPYCKKHLAVTFHEQPEPAQYVEIKMVQLADGSSKTIVRALTDNHVVKVNGEQLQKDDEVVLAPGDQLQIDDTTGTFTQGGYVSYQQPSQSQPSRQVSEQQPSHASKPRWQWPFLVLVLVVLIIAVAAWMYARHPSSQLVIEHPVHDSVAEIQNVSSKSMGTPVAKPKAQVKETQASEPKPATQPATTQSDYELERQAVSGHVEAQYELGKRWVNRHDSVSVVKGIKYLRLAAQNGSVEAQRALRSVFAALQQSAANGSSTADNILREQK